jgi:hypothetical protein
MIDQSLLDYIKKNLAQGNPSEAIRHALLSNGWSEMQVNEAMAAAQLTGDVPLPPAPHPANSPVPPPPPGQPGMHYRPRPAERKPELSSPYSVLISGLLFILVIVFSNRLIKDLSNNASQNFQLIAEALVTMLILGSGFIIHKALGEKSPKFLILARPYYAAAILLVLRLLLHTSAYILDKNVTYGVYIVLVLVIAVLTGMILFLQKFIKKNV